ncbi:MAG: hypothetical protein SCK70_12190 [bacterium]|nr:hypothetical protein [bacterium]
MQALYIITAACLLVSLILDWRKSLHALQIAVKRFLHILPDLLLITALVSLLLYLVPETLIAKYLCTGNMWSGAVIAALVGSVTLMPGFIAYPLCGLLLEKGVTYLVLGIFSTTLMMVGTVTFPLERRYFGAVVALVRNLIALLIALIVGLSIGLFYGEWGW